ncbi:MAG: response regulator transcription factor, partial [Deltaproteobacteria bacterium]|nr:response regulator transcription factor [Deltaproteobacteria bacterium]
MPTKILVVDDDAHIREVVCFALSNAGLEVVEAGNGQKALELFQRAKPDLIVLDITMPELDGLAVCRELRKTSSVPILFLSSRTDEVDRVVGLEVGGDDYVVKPFSPRELVARVQAIMKRVRGQPVNAVDVKELTSSGVRLDLLGHGAYWKDKKVTLTATEF